MAKMEHCSCGSTELSVETYESQAWWIRCRDCGAQTMRSATIEDAAKMWNMMKAYAALDIDVDD